ncbi:hypothetical protein [Flavobacterium piscis]|uniref:Antibiotic biosynthesis monooxygenase n=1 Tax=Flavobacterium piscis TaxID=1114874 RepID=A0ABU1Y2F2_9FLAO|nr:hypothetical protein [Flavobacterium piscis]MDR7208404.1 hypothetical protein [Flavobacterium piscis]
MKANLLSGIVCLALFSYETYSQTETKKSETMKQVFIDKFIVPEKSKQEFLERVSINRNFIKHLNGFLKDDAYERTDDQGNLIYITIAVWENEALLKKAKETVNTQYIKEGFDITAMFTRLNITLERNIYKQVERP